MKLKLRKTDEIEVYSEKDKTLLENVEYYKICNNWKIVEIDGKEVIQYCKNCHVPLVDGDKYIVDVDGCYICQECYNQIKDEV